MSNSQLLEWAQNNQNIIFNVYEQSNKKHEFGAMFLNMKDESNINLYFLKYEQLARDIQLDIERKRSENNPDKNSLFLVIGKPPELEIIDIELKE